MQPRNPAARAGRWSAQHRKTAIFGWILFVVLATVAGGGVSGQAGAIRLGISRALVDRLGPRRLVLLGQADRLAGKADAPLGERPVRRADPREFRGECRTFGSLGPVSLLLRHEATLRDIVEAAAEYRHQLAKLGQTPDRGEWWMPASTFPQWRRRRVPGRGR